MNIDKIREIESKYPVENIRSDGFQVWPMVRFWLWAYCTAKIEPLRSKSQSLSLQQILQILGSFFYGFRSFWGKYHYLTFSDTSERKAIGGLHVDKSIDFINSLLSNPLMIELPLPKHFPKSSVPTIRLVSKMPLYILEWFYYKLNFKRIKIENELVIKDILKEIGISFDYQSILKRNIAQYKVGRILYKLYKPKGIVIQCAYTNTGFVKAFKDSGIPIIEVQHGMLSTSHVAYNVFKKLDPSYFPDYFLSYGHREKAIFTSSNYYIPNDHVLPTGHYYLDIINSSDKHLDDYLPEAIGYETVVSVTGQNLPDLEQQFINFLKQATSQCTEAVFIYIPRNKQSAIYDNKDLPANFLIIDDRDTYEIIRLSNFHTTMFSTCAIESLALGTPNLLINLGNLARVHYGEVLKENLSTQYIDSVEKYVKIINANIRPIRSTVIAENSDLIVNNYRTNIRNILPKIFKATNNI